MDTLLTLCVFFGVIAPFIFNPPKEYPKHQIEQKEIYLPITQKSYNDIRKGEYSLLLHEEKKMPYTVFGKKYKPYCPEIGEITFTTASYYAHAFHGKPTATTEIFNMNDHYTCAHKYYPPGTILEVTNLQNNKKLTVKVNDRGPFVKGRDIDMSLAGAKALGFKEQGTVEVEIYVKWVEITAEIAYGKRDKDGFPI